MYLRNPGPIREYLTPGVEVVSVDPNCVYNSPDSFDEDTDFESNESGSSESGEDFIIDVDDVGPQSTAHPHPLRKVTAANSRHGELTLEECTTSVVYQPIEDTPPTTIGPNQTCLENIYTENFDLAAYITDNDFDFQTTVDNTEEIVTQHMASTNDHCSTSMLQVSATPSTSQQSFAANPDSAASFVAEPTDTYHYVEKWLESCLQDGDSSADTIGLVAGVIDNSPIKLERCPLNDSTPAYFESVKQQQLLFEDAQQPFHIKAEPKRVPLHRATPVKKTPPQLGKGRGKNISMFSMFRNGNAPKEIKKEPPRKCRQIPKKTLEPIKLDVCLDVLKGKETIAHSVEPQKQVKNEEADEEDDDDDDSLIESYNPSHSGASSSGSSVNVVVRPKRAVVLAKQPHPSVAPVKAVVKPSAGPSKRKFRSKSYISSSSSSSGSETTDKITQSGPMEINLKSVSFKREFESSKVATQTKSVAEPAKLAVPQVKPQIVVPKLAVAPKTTNSPIPKVLKQTSMEKNAESVHSKASLKRKHSMVSSDSNDPSGFLEDLLRSRKPFVKRDKNRKTLAPKSGIVRRNVDNPKTVSHVESLPLPKRVVKLASVQKPICTDMVSKLRTSDVTELKPILTVDTKIKVEEAISVKSEVMDAVRESNKIKIGEYSVDVVDMVVKAEESVSNVVGVDSRTPAEIQEEEQAQQKKRLNLEEYLKRRRGFKVKPNDSNQCKLVAQRNQTTAMTQKEEAERAKQEKAWLLSRNLEEIVVVSMGCNTDITISSTVAPTDKADTPSHLINNINDTLIKAHGENVKISSNSLIASIQDVLIKKCIPTNVVDESTSTTGGGKSIEASPAAGKEHGEDKVIMYLPKNRRKVITKSMECQTENLLQFPMLQRVRNYRKRATSRHSYRSRSRSRDNDDYSDRRSSSYDSDSSRSDDTTLDNRKRHTTDRGLSGPGSYRSGNGKYYAGVSRSRISSYRNSLSRSESETTESEENLRLHSTMMAPKQSYGNLRPPPKLNAEQTKIIEERRIVYVGRIETETTKEDLRKKFMSYGPIRQITIHYKDTGMKFGFVTFDNAKDAYRAIECSNRDDTINMYDVSFGGRRAFCKSSYMDLDGSQVDHHQTGYPKAVAPAPANDSFEELLRKMKEKLNQKRSVDSSC